MSGVAVVSRPLQEFVVEWEALDEQSSPEDEATEEELAAAVTRAQRHVKDRFEPIDAETLRLEWMTGEPSS